MTAFFRPANAAELSELRLPVMPDREGLEESLENSKIGTELHS